MTTGNLIVSEDAIETHHQALSRVGNLGAKLEHGFFREAWSDRESLALKHIEEDAARSGLEVWYDSVGNFYAAYGTKRPYVITGSHLDTVRFGGNFDGAIGVYGGLEAIKAIKNSGLPLSKTLVVVGWRGEESDSGGLSYKGSRAAFGLLKPEYLEIPLAKQTLGQAIQSQGYSIDSILAQKGPTNAIHPNFIHAYLELHIEQASKLEKDGHDIGIVTGIRGNKRLRIILEGEADHSGGTPMGPMYRKDANLAGAYIAVELDALARTTITHGKDLVQTQGVLNADHARNQTLCIYRSGLTKVAPIQYSEWDFRSLDDSFLSDYVKTAETLAKRIAKEHGVRCRAEPISTSTSLPETNPRIQQITRHACELLGYRHQSMPSGPGHDAAIVGTQIPIGKDVVPVPVGMIFVPCRNGKSHDPLEYATASQIAKGATVLAQTMYDLAK